MKITNISALEQSLTQEHVMVSKDSNEKYILL